VCVARCGIFLPTIQGGKGDMSRISRVSDVVGLACAGAETAPRAMRMWKRHILQGLGRDEKEEILCEGWSSCMENHR